MAWLNRLIGSKAAALGSYATSGSSASNPEDILLCNSIWPALHEAYPLDADQYAHLAVFAKDRLSRLRSIHPHRRGMGVDIATLVKCTSTLSDQPRENTIQILQQLLQFDEESGKDQGSLAKILEVLASLCLTATVAVDQDPDRGDQIAIVWKKNECLQSAARSHMERKRASMVSISESVIDQRLTVQNLVVNYGFEVDWTSDINEHLNIDESTRVLSIYEHKIWLYAHLRPNTQCALPGAVLGECLDTLNLLFPHHEPDTAAFLKSRGRNFHLLGSCGRRASRDLQNYPRWGRNLDHLLKVLDGPPSGIRQLLPKRREGKLLDLVNFWIAVSVACLTAISFIFGLLAVIFAKMSYDVSLESLRWSREQYLLSLAQACSDAQVSEAVREFCNAK